MKKNKFLLLLLLAASFSPGQAFAQPRQPAATTPVTNEQLETYVQMGTAVTCSLMVDQKIPFVKAIPPAASMVAGVVSAKHGGKFQGNPNQEAMSPQQLFDNAVIFIVGGDKATCYPRLSPEDQKEVDKLLESVKNSQTKTK